MSNNNMRIDEKTIDSVKSGLAAQSAVGNSNKGVTGTGLTAGTEMAERGIRGDNAETLAQSASTAVKQAQAESMQRSHSTERVDADITKKTQPTSEPTLHKSIAAIGDMPEESEIQRLRQELAREKSLRVQAEHLATITRDPKIDEKEMNIINQSMFDADAGSEYITVIPTESKRVILGHKELASGNKVPNYMTFVAKVPQKIDRNAFDALKNTGLFRGYGKE